MTEFTRDEALAMLTDRRFEAMGRRARERVVAAHDWSRNLAAFERLLAPSRIEVQRALHTVDVRAAHAR